MRLPFRSLLPLGAVAVLCLTLVVTLLERVPDVVDRPVAPPQSAARSHPVDLGSAPGPDGTRRVEVGLKLGRPESVPAHDEIRLFVVTYGTRPRLDHGLLRLEGTGCEFRTPPGASLVNNDYLVFEREEGCAGAAAGAPTGRLDLTLVFRGRGRVGLLADLYPLPSIDATWLTFAAWDPSDGRPVPIVRARYVDARGGPGVRRVDLLTWIWDVSQSSAWVWALVALAMLLVAGGALVSGPAEGTVEWREVYRPALGVAAVATGLALCYVVLVPPLQGPDEPDHVLAFARAAGRPELAERTAALARRDHFERIHFDRYERFRPADAASPAVTAWGAEVFAHDVAGRSVTTSMWWQALAPFVRSPGAGGTLLAIRLANALLFGLVAGVGAALLLRTGSDAARSPHVVCLALLLVPTLPFFATHVSEFAVLSSAYVLVAAIVAALFLDGRHTHLLGLPLGLAISLVFAGGRSALPFAGALAALLAARVLTGPVEHAPWRGVKHPSVIFWAGLGVGLVLFELMTTLEFQEGLWPGDAGRVPERFRWLAELLRRHPSSLVIAVPLGWAGEWAVDWWRQRVGPPPAAVSHAARAACVLAAATIAVSLVASWAIRFPVLETFELTRPPSVGAYVSQVVTVASTGLRLWNHDLLLASSLWGGFGWLDTIPPDQYVTFVVLTHAAAAATLLAVLAWQGGWRRPLWLILLAAGWLASLVLYASSSWFLNRNLHGRYLLGLHLAVVAVCWCGLCLLPSPRPSSAPWRRALSRHGLVIAAAAGLHAYALRFILLRYF